MTAQPLPSITVNGQVVPYGIIAAEVQNHSAPKGKPGLAWHKAAQAIAVRTLLLQEAQRRAVAADMQELAPGRWETREEALIRALLEEAVQVIPPSRDQIRAHYEAHLERFRSLALWQVSHILCACDHHDADARQIALDRAQTILAQIQNPARDFAVLAQAHSDCSSKVHGGALGQLRPGDAVPEFEEALADINQGAVCDVPIKTGFGWHIIYVEAKAEPMTLPLEAVAGTIAEALERARWSQGARDLVADLVAAAELVGVAFDRPLAQEAER